MINLIKRLKSHSYSQIMNRLRQILRKRNVYLKYAPVHLTLQPSGRCNLNCPMCFRNTTANSQDLSLEDFKKIIDRFPQANGVCFAGLGEPLLNPALFEMIRYAKEEKMQTIVVTNGLLLGKRIDQIMDSPLDSIAISVNASNQSDYLRICGLMPAESTIYEKMLSGVKRLVEERNRLKKQLAIRVSYVISKSNYHDVPEMINLSERLGVDFVDFHNLIPSETEGFTENRAIFEDDTEIIKFLSSSVKPGSNLIVDLPIPLSRDMPERRCNWYFTGLRIDVNGNVSGCGKAITPNPKYGNVFKDADVWNTPHFQDTRRMFIDENIPFLNCCRYCIENSSYRWVNGRLVKTKKGLNSHYS